MAIHLDEKLKQQSKAAVANMPEAVKKKQVYVITVTAAHAELASEGVLKAVPDSRSSSPSSPADQRS